MKSVHLFFYALLVAIYGFHLNINAMDKFLYNMSTEKKEIDRNIQAGILDSPTPMIRWIIKDKLYKLQNHVEKLGTQHKEFDVNKKYLVLEKCNDGIKYYRKGSLLYFACMWNRPTIAHWLLKQNADPNSVEECDSYTPLHKACTNNHLEIVQLLLLYKANTEHHGYYKKTPLHIACHEDNESIIRELLHVGAHVNAQDKDGLTPLDYLDEKNKYLKKLLRNHGGVKGSKLQKSSASSTTDI